MAVYTYPTSIELQLIQQDLIPRLEADRPVFDFFPVTQEDTYLLAWEQKDNYIGLQQVRGLNGEPPRVKKVGAKRYVVEPGVYGEFEPIDEAALVMRRRWGSISEPVDLSDLVMPLQDKLLGRRYDRIEWMIWTLLSTGTFSVPGPDGAVLHTDSYTLQTFSALTTWGTAANSTPLADFRTVQLLARGHSVDFGAAATAYMNQLTFNNMLSNTNNADLYGRRTAGLGTFNNLGGINELLTGDNLPEIVVYDRGYFDDTNTFQLFIPNNTVIVVGKRPGGVPVGDYCYCRNVNHETPDVASGPYTRVIDKGQQIVPRSIEVHDGHTGACRLYYGSAVVRMSV